MYKIEALAKGHQRDRFDCGEPALNNYLRQTARQHQDKGIAKTFVLVVADAPTQILGFVALTVCEVTSAQMPVTFAKKFSAVVPAARLARLAVASDRQGKKLGEMLLVFAMERTALVAESVGLVAMFVDAKNERAQSFYQRYGFIPLLDDPLKLFLPIETLRDALKK